MRVMSKLHAIALPHWLKPTQESGCMVRDDRMATLSDANE